MNGWQKVFAVTVIMYVGQVIQNILPTPLWIPLGMGLLFGALFAASFFFERKR